MRLLRLHLLRVHLLRMHLPRLRPPRLRLRMALILLMGAVALRMGTQFVEVGQRVLVVLNTE